VSTSARPYDDDDRVRILDPRPCRESFVFGDVLDADGLSDLLDEVAAGPHRVLEGAPEKRFRALDDLPPFGRPNVLDLPDLDGRSTRSDPVYGFKRRREDGGLDLIEARRDRDPAERLAVLRIDLDVDPADFRGVLQLAEVQLVAEEALGLSEDRPDDVRSFDDSLRRDVRVYEVFRCVLH